MKFERAPRSKKRISCDLTIDGNRYKGIVVDVSASGLFVQTTVKPAAGLPVEVALTLPGASEPVILDARVARKKAVPAALLTAAGGGLGLAIDKPPKAFLEFIAKVSPSQAEYATYVLEAVEETERARSSAVTVERGSHSADNPPLATKSFRIHAVEIATGRRNTYLVSCDSEDEATQQVLEQLGDEWQVIFVERV